MEDYPDLRQIIPQHYPSFMSHQHYEMMSMLGGGHQVSDSTTSTTTVTPTPTTTTSPHVGVGFEIMEGFVGSGGGDGGGNGRWPRQETLSLLEIRSKLDPKFKETNQKGPLWDEVSRMMGEEHGYQRSGKKCREKFENLYKYYKKTKEGKAGRQDGKHYRFFRQLEALYGDSSSLVSTSDQAHVVNNLQFCSKKSANEDFQAHRFCTSGSLSISNSSEFDTSSGDDEDNDVMPIPFTENELLEEKKKQLRENRSVKMGKRSWKGKIRDFVDAQMKKLVETQEAWLEKMLKTLEHKEQERMSIEVEWRKQEEARIDRERKLWANERAWFKARDVVLMDALKKFTGSTSSVLAASSPKDLMPKETDETIENRNEINETDIFDSGGDIRWIEEEISSLINIRTGLESRFQQSHDCFNTALWEEIAAKMECLGYNRSAKVCEEKWENISKYFKGSNIDRNKKRKENSRTCPYNFHQLETTYNQGIEFFGHDINEQVEPDTTGLQPNDGMPSNGVNTVRDSCFNFLMGDQGENLWENYGVKLNKGQNQ